MNDTPYYFKVFNKKRHLDFEGVKNSFDKRLEGRITYYYKNGKVKKLEYKDIIRYDSTLNWATFRFAENPIRYGKGEGKTEWKKHYYKNGNLKKIEYGHKINRSYMLTDDTLDLILESYDSLTPSNFWKYYRKDGTLKKQKEYILRNYKTYGEGSIVHCFSSLVETMHFQCKTFSFYKFLF